jgi:hypothetical protein
MAVIKVMKRHMVHLKFTANRQYLGIPQFITELALGHRLEADQRVYYDVKVIRNKGLQLSLKPILHPERGSKPFQGWKSNKQTTRYYISAVSILRALKPNKPVIDERSLVTSVKNGLIVAIVPIRR